MKVKELMTENPVTIDKNERLKRALDLMRKHNVSKLPVTEHKKLAGVLNDGDIVDELGALKNRGISPSGLHVSGVMKRDVHTAEPDGEILHVVEICKKEGVGLLPVTENGGDIVGVVTKADILRLVQSDRRLSDLMTHRLHAVSPEDRVIHARRLMLDHGIERLPVLSAGRLVGIVSELDLAFALDDLKNRDGRREDHELRNLFIKDVMRTSVIVGDPSMTAREAAQRMRKEDIGCLPIVEQGDRIVGMVTRTDLIREIKTL